MGVRYRLLLAVPVLRGHGRRDGLHGCLVLELARDVHLRRELLVRRVLVCHGEDALLREYASEGEEGVGRGDRAPVSLSLASVGVDFESGGWMLLSKCGYEE